MSNEIRVTVIATGFEDTHQQRSSLQSEKIVSLHPRETDVPVYSRKVANERRTIHSYDHSDLEIPSIFRRKDR